MAELFLDVAFVDLGRTGQTGPQGVPREFLLALAFDLIAAHARRQRRLLHQPGHISASVGKFFRYGRLDNRAFSSSNVDLCMTSAADLYPL